MKELINKQTLSEQIYAVLRNDILTQQIPSGTQLRLQGLRERFGISHTPIREALTRLVEDELVTYYSNVGVRVVQLSENDARELFQLLGDLDCLALEYAYLGTSRQTLLEELGEIISSSDEAIANNDLDAWLNYSDQFHLVLYKYANNSRLTAAARKLRAQVTLLTNTYQHLTEHLDTLNSDHKRIYESIAAGDIEEAVKRMRRHMRDNMHRAITAMKK
ncbi:MAG: GntR family transcriptional regulator [Bacillota bacterium]|jgi:DNA-binding GntR family transcriptional regulator